jgi:hypothetical protein
MFLMYEDIVRLFLKTKGVKDNLPFYSVSTSSSMKQPKGLFVPVFEDSGELKEAIQNGAIAAIWDDSIQLPTYVPNHFPIFFTNDVMSSLKDVLKVFLEKLNGDKIETMSTTKFLIDKEKLLKENFSSYDKPVLEYVQNLERGE